MNQILWIYNGVDSSAIDYCVNHTNNCTNEGQVCVNLHNGTYRCDCKSGFRVVPGNCTGLWQTRSRRLPGFADLSYEERLVNLNLQSLEHRRLIADLSLCYKIIHGLICLDFQEFFTFSCNATIRGHIHKLTVPIAKCNRTKYFYSARVVPAWNSLPGDIVSAPNLLSFKRRLRAINLSKFLILPCIL